MAEWHVNAIGERWGQVLDFITVEPLTSVCVCGGGRVTALTLLLLTLLMLL